MLPTILVGDHFFWIKWHFGKHSRSFAEDLARAECPARRSHRFLVAGTTGSEAGEARDRAPGEKYEMRNGDIYINGEKLNEPYTRTQLPRAQWSSENMTPVTLPPDGFFMMGDNRDNSEIAVTSAWFTERR